MNYGTKGTKQELNQITSRKIRRRSGLRSAAFKLVALCICCVIILIGGLGIGVYRGIIDNAPDIKELNFAPSNVASSLYDSDGNLIQTLVEAGSNREIVEYDAIPKDLINAFIAIEDSRFWTHNGVDLRGIARAAYNFVSSGFKDTEGASTITQQLLKNAVFGGGAESNNGDLIVRKLQEQYLAVQLENQMDKTIILQNYLNTINLGNNSLGVQSASQRYFAKNVSDLTLSECAVIAAITQNPYRWDPIRFPENNAQRRETVLDYMEEQGLISAVEKAKALADTEDVYARIADVNNALQEKSKIYSYFTDTVIGELMDDLQDAGYSQTEAHNLIYSSGLQVFTTLDSDIQSIVDEEINNTENYINEYLGASGNALIHYAISSYQLSVTRADGTTQHFSEGHVKLWYQSDDGAGADAKFLFDTEEDAKNCIESYKKWLLVEGDKVIGENVSIILQPQTSFLLMEQDTGYVRAISGGRGEKTHSLSLNRATDTLRQPGSTFKVLADFAPALDISGATLATTQYDAPYVVNEKTINNYWDPSRVWPDGFVGYANIRHGIVYSMNVIATKTFMNIVTPQLGYQYLLSFGFTSLVEYRVDSEGKLFSDITPTLCLGGLTDGVSNIELTAAFAAIANDGIYTEPIFYTKVYDRNGKLLLDNTPTSRTVLKESTAFLLTDAMAESTEGPAHVLYDTAIEANSYMCAIPDMAVAGKSGTTTNDNDSWFVGYTPYYTAGIWMGFDNNGELTGGAVIREIWQKIMTRVHEGLPNTGFGQPPEGVTKVLICAKSGKLALENVCSNDPRGDMTYEEYFAKDTAPTEYCDCHIAITYCNETGNEMLATQNCPEEHLVTKVYMVIRDADKVSQNTANDPDEPSALSEDETGEHIGETIPDGMEDIPENMETASPLDEYADLTFTANGPHTFTADEKYTLPEDAVKEYCWARPQ
ncbi:MAG: transglycosylase domain-containing protein [Lachnospiraceae bacterium]|nr:transglycosylase domain-containing protein [Lachnospiraceae bacterium]